MHVVPCRTRTHRQTPHVHTHSTPRTAPQQHSVERSRTERKRRVRVTLYTCSRQATTDVPCKRSPHSIPATTRTHSIPPPSSLPPPPLSLHAAIVCVRRCPVEWRHVELGVGRSPMVNVVNASELCHLVNTQQVEVPQQTKRQAGKYGAHKQCDGNACGRGQET